MSIKMGICDSGCTDQRWTKEGPIELMAHAVNSKEKWSVVDFKSNSWLETAIPPVERRLAVLLKELKI